jgi:hypothetical protein
MFKIKYTLDPEDQSDPVPLGSLKIGGSCGEIVIENTYIDSWLLALSEFAKSTSKETIQKLSILEEIQVIDVEISHNKLNLHYAGSHVSGDISEFSKCVVRAAHDFISQSKAEKWDVNNETIHALESLLGL